jgi:hypothetical protein
MGDSIHGGSHSNIPRGPKAGEAYLLSRATSTAVVAARSILMSGGTEEAALKTAKAAAQSVLSPSSGYDNDTIAGKSASYLRRRKAKRQAEVVASMALVSASTTVRGGSESFDWEVMTQQSPRQPQDHQHQQHQCNNVQHSPSNNSMDYYNHIVTRTMEDPSVLSGSIRSGGNISRAGSNVNPLFPLPPRAPSPFRRGSATSQSVERAPSRGAQSVERAPSRGPITSQSMATTSQSTESSLERKPPRADSFRKGPTTSQSVGNKQKKEARNELKKVVAKHSQQKPDRMSERDLTGAIKKQRSLRKNLAASAYDEDPIYDSHLDRAEQDLNVQSQGVSSCVSSSSSSSSKEEGDDSTVDTRDNVTEVRSEEEMLNGNFFQTHVLWPITGVFNSLNCEPLPDSVQRDRDKDDDQIERRIESSRTPTGKSRGQTEKAIFDEDETRDDIDERLTNNSDTNHSDDALRGSKFSREDSTLDTDDRSAASVSHASSGTSFGSRQLMQELNSSSSEEGEIQIRSTIRDTMEKIVSKSRRALDKEPKYEERTWRSYEQRDDENPEVDKMELVVVVDVEKKEVAQQKKRWFGRNKKKGQENHFEI